MTQLTLKASSTVTAYIDGFSFTGSMEEMQAWWNALRSNNTFSNTLLKIWKHKENTNIIEKNTLVEFSV